MQVLIIDFGSQFTHLILRNIRHQGVYCEIQHPSKKGNVKFHKNLKGIILSGGPRTITAYEIKFVKMLLQENPKIPILGICYGMQLLAAVNKHKIKSYIKSEYGPETINILKTHPLLSNINKKSFQAWMSHGDHIDLNPKRNGTLLAQSSTGTCAAASFGPHHVGVQYHPEVSHTEYGDLILKNFIKNIVKANKDWHPKQIFKDVDTLICDQIIQPKRRVLCAISGGVDSTVVGKMLANKCPKQVHFVHVDHGLGRYKESEHVIKTLRHAGIPVILLSAQQQFLKPLRGVTDPEQKRKIIGTQFIRLFETYAKKHNLTHLIQGTLYPDIIESKSIVGKSSKIKTHHNVGGIPKDCKLGIIEPFCHLYKDDVRVLGNVLGLPKSLIGRHPFPGPGLAIRILGDVSENKLKVIRECDRILIKFLRDKKLYDKIWQAGCILLPVKSVGVKGDKRAYQPVVAIRCVVSKNAMTAHAARLSINDLEDCATSILNQVQGVGRVVYDISPKPPATIEWE
jgi:GMP synthase (glutamine-hydrolysing)